MRSVSLVQTVRQTVVCLAQDFLFVLFVLIITGQCRCTDYREPLLLRGGENCLHMPWLRLNHNIG